MGLLSRGGAARPDVQILPGELKGTEAAEPGAALTGRRDEGRLNELARCIRERDREDRQLANVMLAHAVEKGRWLTEAKAMVPYGEWGNWLKEKVDYSQSKAQGLMKLYQKFGSEQESLFGPPKSQTLGNLSVTKALMLIDIPDEELGKIMEGHDLESMTTREVAALKKDLADAKAQAAQAQAERSAAEQAREKLSADMALANERIAGLNAEVEARTAAAARLEKELEELRSRPVDVAVEADPAAIEAARKEAEAAMRDKLDKEKQAKIRAENSLKEAERDLENAHRVLAKMRDENCELREKMESADKKASLAANEEFVLFRTLLDQTRESANKMVGVLLKTRNKDPEGAKGMEADLLALSGEIRDAAQG